MRKLKILSLTLLLLLSAVLFLSVYLAEATLHPKRKVISNRSLQIAHEVSRKYGCGLNDVQITASEGVALKAWFFDCKSSRVVLLLHGQADNRAGMMDYAQLLLRNRYSAVLPDLRAHGLSGGAVATYGLKEADDVHRWVQWLKKIRPDSSVYGLGESMGAAILLQSLKNEDGFRAVVAESSFSNFREIGYDRLGKFFGSGSISRGFMRPIVSLAFTYSYLRYGIDLESVSPESVVAATWIPILLIHGANDRSIPPRHSRRIASVAHQNVDLWVVANAGHTGVLGRRPVEFADRVCNLFNSGN